MKKFIFLMQGLMVFKFDEPWMNISKDVPAKIELNDRDKEEQLMYEKLFKDHDSYQKNLMR